MPKLPSPIPHPLSYLDAPGWLREALEWVVGMDWPEGDEKAMRQLADAWHEAGREVGPMLEESDLAALEAVAALGGPDGEAAQALLTLWRRLGGSPEATLSQVVGLFDDLGEVVDATANEIEGVKLEFYLELLLMLAELLILIATAAVSGGVSLAGAGPIMMATRFAIQRILRRAADQIIKRTVKKALREKVNDVVGDRLKSNLGRFGARTAREALEEGFEEAGISAATQTYQVSEGNRQGLDRPEIVQSFGVGTLAGSVANVTSLGGIRAGTGLGQFGERSLRGAVGEVLADITVGVVTGQEVTWTSVGMAAASGTAGSAVGAGQHMLDSGLGLSHDVVFDALSERIAPTAAGVAAGSQAIVHASEPTERGVAASSATQTAEAGHTTSLVTGNAADLAGHTNVLAPVAGPTGTVAPPSTPDAFTTSPSPSPATAAPAAAPATPTAAVAAPPAQAQAPAPVPRTPAQAVPTAPPIAPPPQPAGSSSPAGEPFLLVTPTPVPVQPKAFRPEIVPGRPAALIDNPQTRQEYADYVRIEINQALRARLTTLVGELIDSGIVSPRRRQELRDHGIAALTQADIEPIAEELWRISNRALLNPNWGFSFGGENDTAGTSQATGRDVPPPVESTRQYFQPGKYNPPLTLHQQDVELAVPRDADGVPVRFADLRGDWLRLMNDGGPAADLCRAINCTDVVLSVLDTWLHGRPRVAAPRTYDRFTFDNELRPRGGEIDGAARIEAATGGLLQQFTSDREGFLGLEAVLREAGHGACAVLIQERPNGDVHASTVHNQNGEILYVDAQNPGAVLTGRPVGALRSDILVLGPDSTQIDIGTPRGHWAAPGPADPEGAPSAWSAPGVDPELMFRDPTPEQLRALGVGAVTAADLGVSDTDLTAEERGRLTRMAMVEPGSLRFLERSLSPQSSEDAGMADLRAWLRSTASVQNPIHTVLWGDGTQAVMDARRVDAARQAGLPAIPVIVHAPSETLTAGIGMDGPLRNDLRSLAAGGWVVGGDTGEVLEARGNRPTTWGLAAVFRAADQTSFLPGDLFGTTHRPVFLAGPPGPAARPVLGRTIDHKLERLIDRARRNAGAVQLDLAALGHQMHNLREKIKTIDSLSRKYAVESRRFGGNPYAFATGHANDVLRFTIELPEGDGYTDSLENALADLNGRGYRVVEVKNFWAPGNRYMGVNSTVLSSSGQLFEVQFATRLSLRVNEMTHDLYEVVRSVDELAARRVHALLSMISLNKARRMAEAIPPGLGTRYPPSDNGLPKWIYESRRAWDAYLLWLAENQRHFPEIVAEFHLSATDLPISAKRLASLRDSDVGVLRSL